LLLSAVVVFYANELKCKQSNDDSLRSGGTCDLRSGFFWDCCQQIEGVTSGEAVGKNHSTWALSFLPIPNCVVKFVACECLCWWSNSIFEKKFSSQILYDDIFIRRM